MANESKVIGYRVLISAPILNPVLQTFTMSRRAADDWLEARMEELGLDDAVGYLFAVSETVVREIRGKHRRRAV